MVALSQACEETIAELRRDLASGAAVERSGRLPGQYQRSVADGDRLASTSHALSACPTSKGQLLGRQRSIPMKTDMVSTACAVFDRFKKPLSVAVGAALLLPEDEVAYG